MAYECVLNNVLKDGVVVSTHLTIGEAYQEKHRLENALDFSLEVAIIGVTRDAMDKIMDTITSMTVDAGGFVAGGFSIASSENEDDQA